jgi:hypothetical protein
MKLIASTILTLVLLTGCGAQPNLNALLGTPPTSDAAPPASNGSGGVGTFTSAQTADASAELACTHFRDVARDYSAGVLTLSEFRTKVQEVWKDAQYSDTPGIAGGARGLLADLTAGHYDHAAKMVTRLARACTAAGV